jgi:anti-sigma factor RsiW
MSDAVSTLSEREIAELCAFADGTLPPERVKDIEARVAASPELLELVERQRQAVAATRALSAEPLPASLVDAVESLRSGRRARRSRGRPLVPRLALAGGLAAVLVVVAAVVLSGGPAGPTVADAATLASQPATAPAPSAQSATRLAVDVEGIPFPNLEQFAGWQASGVHEGHIDGRDATAVFYRKDGRRIAYVIVAGDGLPHPSGAQTSTRGGVEYQTLRVNGRLAVTWRRGGHTCVLIGDAPEGELLDLASWPVIA